MTMIKGNSAENRCSLHRDFLVPSSGFVYGFCMVCVWFLYQSIQKHYTNLTISLHKPRIKWGSVREGSNKCFSSVLEM